VAVNAMETRPGVASQFESAAGTFGSLLH
jgi:hypothetical protein